MSTACVSPLIVAIATAGTGEHCVLSICKWVMVGATHSETCRAAGAAHYAAGNPISPIQTGVPGSYMGKTPTATLFKGTG